MLRDTGRGGQREEAGGHLQCGRLLRALQTVSSGQRDKHDNSKLRHSLVVHFQQPMKMMQFRTDPT